MLLMVYRFLKTTASLGLELSGMRWYGDYFYLFAAVPDVRGYHDHLQRSHSSRFCSLFNMIFLR